MAPMKTLNQSNQYNSRYGEDVARQANVLASCYVVDAAGSLKGLHYCTTLAAGTYSLCPLLPVCASPVLNHILTIFQGPSGIPEVPISGLPSPPSSPPLAAFTSDNELAIKPKPKRNNTSALGSTGARTRRGGATLRIREECERFFCEIMKVVFHGERNSPTHGSGLTSVYQHHNNHTHPSLDQSPNNSHCRSLDRDAMTARNSVVSIDSGYFGSYTGDDHLHNNSNSRSDVRQQLTPPCDGDYVDNDISFESPVTTGSGVEATAWMEIWDYQGGASFLAFVAEDFTTGEKSLFTFFDAGVVGCDLKKALVALIELAEVPLGCSRLVICIDRSTDADELQPLTKGLQWAGFELDTLDQWASIRDVTSSKWIFMGMDV